MAVNAYQVRLQAQAFLESLRGMTPKEREQKPSFGYGERFNQLLGLAKEVAPEIDSRLWPQPLKSGEADIYVPQTTNARYVEIETYVREILNNLPDEPLMPSKG